MDDLINRQAAIEVCLRYNGVGWVWSQILDEIEKMPSVDAVEVVRCKDCKYCSHDVIFSQHWCVGRLVSLDDYCSNGVRNDV